VVFGIILGLSTGRQGLIILQPVEAAFMGLSFGELSHEADLIVLGRVLYERIIGAGTLGAGLETVLYLLKKCSRERTREIQ
jgi:hypothetical protein